MRRLRIAALAATVAPLWSLTASAQSRTALAAVDRYVRQEIRRERVPGVSVAIVRDGKVILALPQVRTDGHRARQSR
jgi:CubicO group peptidase (beta-lactamase class C family)